MTAARTRGSECRSIIVTDPCAQPNPRLVVAALQAGALGVLDISPLAGAGLDRAERDLAEITRQVDLPFAVRLPHRALGAEPAAAALARILADPAHRQVTTVIVAGPHGEAPVPAAVADREVLFEVVSREEAQLALRLGASGLVAKGAESGGRVGDTEAFVLSQQIGSLDVPFWVQGGIGLHTAAAAVAGGAAGVVLDGQVALTREAGLPEPTRRAVEAMDGSETRVVARHRLYVRPDLPSAALHEGAAPSEVADRLGPDIGVDLVPLGQDAAAAAELARRHVTVEGVVRAVAQAMADHLRHATRHRPLAPGRGLAGRLGIRYPVAQGPMTRVSDRATFAQAVADRGGLPFLALAVLDGPQVHELLRATAELVGDRPWGVGLLGFVPPEVRQAQLEAICEVRPPAALIAGGRPAQARPLDEAGIRTFLHVPSPGLLDRFLAQGARRFVFEGRECGGHVGPRASFPLWDAQVSRLLEVDQPEDLEVLFAGGIHDARSAAMVATVAAPLAARGAACGVLMGTAYLFTEEAVATGALTPTFQDMARRCRSTVLLETAPGHATRCVETHYVRTFTRRKAELEASGAPPDAMWAELESLNLGRLRVASKGLVREGDQVVVVDAGTQQREGMFMIGQAATLRHEPTSIADLHEEVTTGATERLAAAEDATGPDREPAVARRGPRHRRAGEGGDDVAIVGMAAVFPGAADTEEYWANVLAGRDCVTEVPAERWAADRFHDLDGSGPQPTDRGAGRSPSRWGGFLPWVPFDPLRYGLPPRSLASVETVQLLSLEVAARALADAGYRERPFDRERASVVFGTEGGNDLSQAYGFRTAHQLLGGGPLPSGLERHLPRLTEDSFPGVLTNVVAGRIANRLDLGGVNYTVDAACAASLAALDAACKELVTGGSDMVLCGAADVHNSLHDFLLFASVHALSPTGRCRTFDAGADGIALGEGVACVVLKRLEDATRDGPRVSAGVDGIGGASDGRHLGLTAPRADGQVRALRRAYDRASAPPSRVRLVEAHGTGTVVGDRTELTALGEVFGEAGTPVGHTALGSVKSQIGHTKCAAGLAGLVKAARAVYAGVLPPTSNLGTPNGAYEAASSPFRFLDRPAPWPDEDRRAGISAFGFGGTNFHAVLRSHPGGDRPRHGLDRWPAELFLVRADDEAEAAQRIEQLRGLVDRVIERDPQGERHRLRDLAWTTSVSGRGPVQVAVVATDLPDLATKLAQAVTPGPAGQGVVTRSAAVSGRPKLAFLHPGQGSQYPGMLRDLLVAFPRLQSTLRLGPRWVDAMYPPMALGPDDRAAQAAALADTAVAQPALGLAALVVTRLLGELGLRPDAVAGHSYGELAALATAGALSPEALVALSQARAEAMVTAARSHGDDPGAMAAVALAADELRPHLDGSPDLVVANHNTPRQTVVSGPSSAVESLVASLAGAGIGAKRLAVSAAFHSPLVAPAGEALAAHLGETEVATPAVPVWSGAEARPYPADPDAIRATLAGQLSRPVRFVEQVEEMYGAGIRVFVEAGPGRVLTQMVGRILGDRPHLAVPCDVPGEAGLHRLLLTLAELATTDLPVDVDALFAGRAARLDLGDLPLAPPGWRINGHLVCTADGEPVDGGLQPATRLPEVTMERSTDPTEPRPQDEVVRDYLAGMRALADAQREVVLRFLGDEPVPEDLLALGLPAGWDDREPVERDEPRPGDPAPRHRARGTSQADRNGGPGRGTAPAAGPAPAPTAAPSTPATRPRLGAAELLELVLAVVADRTGYPRDMLDPDLDLEADLSIDSIKRIEIIGELADRAQLATMDPAAGADEWVVEQLARLKTLRAIVGWIEEHLLPGAETPGHDRDHDGGREHAQGEGQGQGDDRRPSADRTTPDRRGPGTGRRSTGPAAERPPARRTGPAPTRPTLTPAPPRTGPSTPRRSPTRGPVPAPPTPTVPVATRRLLFETVTVPPAMPTTSLAGSRFAVVSGPWEGLSELTGRLEAAGASVEVLPMHRGAPHRGLPVDAARALAEVDGVVHLGGIDPAGPVDARDVFAALRPALAGRCSTFVALADGRHRADLGSATGTPGLMRALARDLPDRRVRVVELADHFDDPGAAARLVADEAMGARAEPVSVVYQDGARTTRELGKAQPLEEVRPTLPLDGESVVVVTGGARGITARGVVALAQATGCRLELMGRSPLPPADEDPATARAADRPALRRAVLAQQGTLAPAEVERHCDRILAAREIRATLRSLSQLGTPVTYHQVDVRDATALTDALAGIRRRRGRIDAVVHGAGVIDDHLALEKSDASFHHVFSTKVDAARTLLAHLEDDVRLVVLFGSISGVFGNRGQVDYSAANDALGNLANRFDGVGGRRVVCVHWGPWAGDDLTGPGMVSAELERSYAQRGIGLIHPDEGVAGLLQEMATLPGEPAEVVIMRADPAAFVPAVVPAGPRGTSSGRTSGNGSEAAHPEGQGAVTLAELTVADGAPTSGDG